MENENLKDEQAKDNIVKPDVSSRFLSEFDGRKETCIRRDRTRTTNYNGEELQMNSYSCSTCKEDYKFEERRHKFCPFCGNEYKFETDVSI